jgi:hypothetical protein
MDVLVDSQQAIAETRRKEHICGNQFAIRSAKPRLGICSLSRFTTSAQTRATGFRTLITFTTTVIQKIGDMLSIVVDFNLLLHYSPAHCPRHEPIVNS